MSASRSFEISAGTDDALEHRRSQSRELRANFADLVAQRDHVVEVVAAELRDGLGSRDGDVDADFSEHLDRIRMNRLRMTAGAEHVDGAARRVTKQRLGDLRASAVAGADK